MARKLYTGPLVDVSFDRDICQHAAECVRGMPDVFNTKKRPWINPEKATTPELAQHLREVIWRCPSRALRVEEHAEAPTPVQIGADERIRVTSEETTVGGEPPVERVDQP